MKKQENKALPKSRFREDASNRHSIYSVAYEFLVQCPQCGKCAKILKTEPENLSLFAPRRLTCLHCSLVKEWKGQSVKLGSSRDPYFGLPLWLQAPCCGHVLWAYNLRHLNLVEHYVAAALREKQQHPQWGWQNKSLFNRLPHWIKSAHNRERVLKAIEKLKAK